MSRAYYNEFDPHAAAWLRELIKARLIADGDVDERSIEDVRPNELKGYTQCHFFAGIGGWSFALRLSGWPDDRQVWTGSCPCQPFSAAGKGKGFADERHLWPAFYHLIQERRPVCVFGEQVASKDGLAWLDLVQADMEGAGYAFGANDLCSAGVGAPHIRQRLYFVADSSIGAFGAHNRKPGSSLQQQEPTGRRSIFGELAHHHRERLPIGSEPYSGATQSEQQTPRRSDTGGRGEIVGLGNTNDGGSRRDARTVPSTESSVEGRVRSVADGAELTGATCELGDTECDGLRISGRLATDIANESGYWSLCDWIACRDGKWRPVEPGTFPLAHGVPGRVGLLRGYGNAIVPQVAAAFIASYLDL